MFRIQVNVHLDDKSSAAEPSVIKLGMVMQHYEPDCLSKRLVCCLQGQGHSEGSYKGSYNQNMDMLYIIWTANPFANKFGLMSLYH